MPRAAETKARETKPAPAKHYKPRQEISLLLKYLIFAFNFLFVLAGLGLVGLGSYLYGQDPRGVSSFADLVLNPAIVLVFFGLAVCAISLCGCMGALREHVGLLKTFALAIFLSYILLVILTFVVFLLFYSDAGTGVSIRTVLLTATANYAANPNWRDLMDWLHSALGCCGATERGYKDWGLTAAYNCSSANELPEACGVPPSCCYPGTPSAHVQCWRDAQLKSITELQTGRLVRTEGCLQPLQAAFEAHAVIVGAAIGAFILPVCLGVMLSNVLGKQVEKQRYLLDREAKREEKRRRRLKHRFRDPFAQTFSRRRNRSSDAAAVMDETRELSPPANARAQPSAASDPIAELRATHLTQDMLRGSETEPSLDDKRKEERRKRASPVKEPKPSTSAASPREPSSSTSAPNLLQSREGKLSTSRGEAAKPSASKPSREAGARASSAKPSSRSPPEAKAAPRRRRDEPRLPPPPQQPRRPARSRDGPRREEPNAQLRIVEITDDDPQA